MAARKRGRDEPEQSIKRLRGSEERVWEYVHSSQLLVTSASTSVPPPPPPPVPAATNVSVYGTDVVVLVTSKASVVDEWVARQTGLAYGVDVEWKPNRVKGLADNKVAVLQICSGCECLIVQTLFLDRVPDRLVKFLADPEKKLGGVGIGQDASKLMRDFQWKCSGLVELGGLAAEKLGNRALRHTGLKGLASVLIGFRMDKPKSVTMSDWSRRHLVHSQVKYACVDAWVSYSILDKLLNVDVGTS